MEINAKTDLRAAIPEPSEIDASRRDVHAPVNMGKSHRCDLQTAIRRRLINRRKIINGLRGTGRWGLTIHGVQFYTEF